MVVRFRHNGQGLKRCSLILKYCLSALENLGLRDCMHRPSGSRY